MATKWIIHQPGFTLRSRLLHWRIQSMNESWHSRQRGYTFCWGSSPHIKFHGQPQTFVQITWPLENSNTRHLFIIVFPFCPSYTLTSVLSPFAISLLLCHQNLRECMCSIFKIPPCCHISFSYFMGFDIIIICQRIQTTCSHTSCCHH